MRAHHCVVLLLLLLAAPPVAHAHKPVFMTAEPTGSEPEVKLGDGTTSWVVYGAVARAGQVRTVSFQLDAGDDVLLQLLIPDRPPEVDRLLEQLPSVELEHAGRSTLLEPERMGESFFEPFSAARYRMLLEHREPGVAGGRYVVRIAAARPARFALVVGQVERFGPRDFATLPGVIGAAQAWYRGTPANATSEVQQRAWMAAAWLVLAGVPLLGLLLWLRRRRRRRKR